MKPNATLHQQASETPVRLTPRQLEVLALLCEGLPNKLICRRLNIATGTVKIHISCILRELGVTSRLQAALSARRCGLLGEPNEGAPQQGASPAAVDHALVASSSTEYRASRQLAAA